MKQFSFIIPVYNVEKYIKECLDSILIQTYKNFEVILINDGSTDNSGILCDEYAKLDNRVKVIHTKNGGLSKARNVGLEEATGKYIIFLDSDDYWVSNELHKIAQKCDDNKLDILAYNYEIYDEVNSKVSVKSGIDFQDINNEIMNGEQYLKSVISKNPLYGWYSWLYVIKRDIFTKFKLKFKPGIKYEDVDLTYRIILSASRVMFIDKVILRYRTKRMGAITNITNINTEKHKLEVIKNNIKKVQNLPIDDELKLLICNNFSCMFYSSLILYYDINDKRYRSELMLELKKSLWVCKYTTNIAQKNIYYLINILGIKVVSYILHIRKLIKK